MSKRILIIEDDGELGLLIAARLHSAGFETQQVADALAGVQAAHANRPDLVVLDLRMPAGGGISVLRRLRMSARTRAVPVVVLTGLMDEAKREEAIAAGADAYLEKPYEPMRLLAEVHRLLGTQEQRKKSNAA